MSGIIGVYNCDGVVDCGVLRSMADALHHRGPDQNRIWSKGNIGFAHRMLCTTPESTEEKLPFYDPDSNLAITSDARLDNRDYLINALNRSTFKMKVIPDSQIILEAYKKWGQDCLEHLLGDFSFAIWDGNKQSLFCARDHLGIKPFYYYHVNGAFFFCSESWVIAKHSGVPIAINEPRIADFLTPHLEGFGKISTFYQGIYRLPPAHFLLIRNGKVELAQYWQLQPCTPTIYRSDQDYQEELAEILTSAVASRCRGIESPSVLLSGGVDSATIMGITRKLYLDRLQIPVQTYSGISSDISKCIESQMISRLIALQGVSSNLYNPSNLSGLADKLFPLVEKIQEPFDIYMVLVFLLYQQAAENGVKVMLDGVDGDIVASLSPSYPSKLFRNVSFLSAITETKLQSKGYYAGAYSTQKLLFRYFISAYTPPGIMQWHRKRSTASMIERTITDSVISDNFANLIKLRERLEEFEKYNTQKQNSPFPHGTYISGIEHPFLTVALERYDRVASLCSVEPRHPLLDKRVIDFFSNLPWNQLAREGWTKYLLRKVAQRYVQHEVCWRTGKEHVGWKFLRALLTQKNETISHLISDQYNKLEYYFNYKFEINQTINYNDSKTTSKTAVHPEIAGVALWLNNQD